MADVKTYFKQPKGYRKNPKYLKAVKQLPCFVCHKEGVDAHHIIGAGKGGMGITAPDTETIPLCRLCHSKIHLDYTWFDQEEAVEITRNKIIALKLISPLDI